MQARLNIRSIVILMVSTTLLWASSQLPRSREATFIESTSPSEVMIRATGYGVDNKHWRPKAKTLDKSANQDARKAAVWFILMGSTDPLLQTDAEKTRFDKIQADFFKPKNIRKFISWEADYYETRVKIEGGKKLKIEKNFKINKTLLKEHLVERGVLPEMSVVSASTGMPTIMVIPEAQEDMAPIEILRNDPFYKKGAEVIESYLTVRRFEVIVPEQQQALQELSATQYALTGSSQDYSYLLALSIGSDIYITYNITVKDRQVGSTQVKKAIVGCRAYETTTSRLLGTETGYSPERPAAAAVVIEEAMHNSIDKVLSRITSYWKKDLQQGIQYKLMVKIHQTFDKSQAEEIIFALGDVVRAMASHYKENVVADYTYDVLVWCDGEQYQTATDLYRFFKRNYKGMGTIEKVSLSRKLILLNVTGQ